MRSWFGATQSAVAALCASVIVFAVGVIVYGGHDMGPHVVAAVGAVLAEVPLVVLVIEKLADARRHREWSFVKQTVGKRMAAVAVDIVALYGITWSPLAHHANLARYENRYRLSEVHLAALRSQLEGLALGATSSDYEDARKVELRLAWLVGDLSQLPKVPRRPGIELSILTATLGLVASFLTATKPRRATRRTQRRAVGQPSSGTIDPDEFWRARMQQQTAFLVSRPVEK
jgi:hypothetical protein